MAKIKRKPIKIRKPIYREYCSCWNIKTFSIEGTSRMILGDHMPSEQMQHFIDTTNYMIPVYYEDVFNEGIHTCLDNGIPVALLVEDKVDEDILEKMVNVPHCSLYMSSKIITLNEDFMMDYMAYAKSNMILIALSVEYNPYSTHIIELCDRIDDVKNFASHILLKVPPISDDIMHDKVNDMERFKKIYRADVPSRNWVVKESVLETILGKVSRFIRGKKLTMEYIYPICSDGRYRQIKNRSKEPLGMRGFFFKKIDGEFQVTETSEDFDCPTCKKPIFT